MASHRTGYMLAIHIVPLEMKNPVILEEFVTVEEVNISDDRGYFRR